MNTETASQHREWLKLHNSAELDYEIMMNTARALPVSELLRCADRLYNDLHFADQVRRKAARMMEG
jgi:hypothetical protein